MLGWSSPHALQGNFYDSGSYVNWSDVDAYLHGRFQIWWSNLPSGPLTFSNVFEGVMIVTALELIHGPDLLVSYVTGTTSPNYPITPHFTTAELLSIFEKIVQAQNTVHGNTLPSGDYAWWLPYNHHCVFSADAYLLLRRNPTAVAQLASMVPPVLVAGLEHKLLAASDSAVLTTGEPGGGLVDFQAWAEEMAAACSIPGPCTPWVINFWGELIGVVALIQGMHDLLPLAHPSYVAQPLVPTADMGADLVSCFQLWQQRAFPFAGPTFIATPLNPGPPSLTPPYTEWAGPSNAPWPLVLSVGNADPTAGQDWDGSMHQLARAVLSMHHLGYVFTSADQRLILNRLLEWATPASEAWGPASAMTCTTWSGNTPLTADPATTVPTERYLWDGNLACDGNPNAPAPKLIEVLSGPLALVRSGQANTPTPAVQEICWNILRVVGSLYRGGGWVSYDDNFAGFSDLPNDAEGTYCAIAILRLLDREPLRLGTQSIAPTSEGTASMAGLDDFLHVFGGPIATIVQPPGSPYSWPAAPIYQPG